MARVSFLSALPPIALQPTAAAPSMPKREAAKQLASTISPAEKKLRAIVHRPVAVLPPMIHGRWSALKIATRSQNHAVNSSATNIAVAAPDNVSLAPPIWPSAPLLAANRHPALTVYAYSFFRFGKQSSTFAGGQYGGSQSGVIAAYPLAGFKEPTGQSSLALLVRAAVAHDDVEEREVAAGLRWQPARKFPVTVAAERRFRNARPDAFAVYLAGGKSAALPMAFKLDAFAQAGIVSGTDGGPFFDFNTRAVRKLSVTGKIPVTLGGGIWGGGQQSVFRIDAGPTIGTEVPLGKARLRLNADWRFRVAGDAQPASGPALTLSTSF